MPGISDFKNALAGGGSRASLFFVQLNLPGFVSNAPNVISAATFLAESASLPKTTINDIAVPFQGREIHIAGQKKFEETWKVSIYNDTNFAIRNGMEEWLQNIQDSASSVGMASPLDYQVDMQVFQLDRTGVAIKQYNFYDCWPTEIGEIELKQEAETAIEQFDVQFRFNYFDTPELIALPQMSGATLQFVAQIAL